MTPRLYRLGLVACILLALVSGVFWFVYQSNVQILVRSVALSGAEGPAGDRLRMAESFRNRSGLLAIAFVLGSSGFLIGLVRSARRTRGNRHGTSGAGA